MYHKKKNTLINIFCTADIVVVAAVDKVVVGTAGKADIVTDIVVAVVATV